MKQLFWIIFLFCIPALGFAQVNHWETAISGTDTFRYFIGNQEPPAGWKDLQYIDSSWLYGMGGIGYGENNFNTLIPDSTMSVYVRRSFLVTDTANIYAAVLNIDYDDAFVAWLNGTEIARDNIGTTGDIPAFNTPAATSHEGLMHQGLPPAYFIIPRQKLLPLLRKGKNILAVQVNNSGIASSDLTAIIFLSFGMTTGSQTYASTPSWFVAPVVTGYNLPLVIINTHSQTIPDGTKINVDFGIINDGAGRFNDPLDPWNEYKGRAGIEIRGSSSTMFPKKSYNLETRDSAGIQIDTMLLGMPSDNDWALYGPYSDKSLIRNYLSYYLSNAIGRYAPRTRMCELFINGQYQGVYLLLERIRRGKNRVHIAKLMPTDNTGIKLTGGYIVKIDRSSTGDYTDGWYSKYLPPTSNYPVFFAFDYPKYTNIIPAQTEYIKGKINFFEDLLKGEQYSDPIMGYRSVIDVNSFVDHFILNELSRNVDAYRLSTFLYKDRDDRDPRINIGPIWDYDLTFGNADYYNANLTNGWAYQHPSISEPDNFPTPFWWQRFISDSYFVNTLHCRWNQLRQGSLNTDSITAFIDSAVVKLGPAQQRNFTQFPVLGTWIWPNSFVGTTYEQEIAFLKNWISDRASWLDANMPGICTISDAETENSLSAVVRVYPNPAINDVNIEIQDQGAEKLRIIILTIYGQAVYTKEIEGETYYIEKISLKPGVYLVKVSGRSEERILKIVVE